MFRSTVSSSILHYSWCKQSWFIHSRVFPLSKHKWEYQKHNNKQHGRKTFLNNRIESELIMHWKRPFTVKHRGVCRNSENCNKTEIPSNPGEQRHEDVRARPPTHDIHILFVCWFAQLSRFIYWFLWRIICWPFYHKLFKIKSFIRFSGNIIYFLEISSLFYKTWKCYRFLLFLRCSIGFINKNFPLKTNISTFLNYSGNSAPKNHKQWKSQGFHSHCVASSSYWVRIWSDLTFRLLW